MASVHELLAKASGQIGGVAKGKTAPRDMGGFKFRGIDQVLAAVHPVFAELGLSMGSEVVSITREQRVRATDRGERHEYLTLAHMRYRVYAPDGSSVAYEAVGEGLDGWDKASNKAMSAALKYALGQCLLLPFDAEDADAANYEESAPPQYGAPAQRPQRPAAPAPPSGDEYGTLKWPFGKHQGAPMSQIPVEYFEWWMEKKGLLDETGPFGANNAALNNAMRARIASVPPVGAARAATNAAPAPDDDEPSYPDADAPY